MFLKTDLGKVTEKMRVLVIVPAYNEQNNITAVINSINNAAASLKDEIEYLVVDDCSRDGTLGILREGKRNYISLPVNLGIGGGVQSGYLYALENCFDVAVQIDGDGQHDPFYLDNVLEPIRKDEADVVIGSRFLNGDGFQSSALRRIGIKFLSGVIGCVCGVKIKDVTSGFRAVNHKGISFFAHNYAQDYPEPEAIVMCAKKKFRIKEVPVIMKERQGGESSISPMRSVYYMIKVTIAVVFAAFLRI